MLTAAMCGLGHGQAVAQSLNVSDQGDLMRQIKSAYSDGRFSEFSRLAQQLPDNHLFTPYIEIWRFRFFIKGQEKQSPDDVVVWRSEEVLPLLNRYPATWPTEQLRRDWLQQLARAGQWDLYRQQRTELKYRPDQGVECADLYLSAYQGQVNKPALNKVVSSEKRLARTCRTLLKTLYYRDIIQAADLDRHVLHLVADKQVSAATQFVDEMSDTAWGRGIDTRALSNAVDNPDKALKQAKSSGTDLIVATAIARKAIADPAEAAALVQAQYAQRLSESTSRWLWAHIGHRAALLWQPEASKYFSKSSPEAMSGEQMEWRTRAALLQENWPLVLQTIDEMPQELKDNRAWQYWRGRALTATGKTVEARQEWIRAANSFSFYGKLANEELGTTVTAPLKPQPLTQQELERARKNPGLQRALALYDAGLRMDGFWEFNLQIAQMKDRELLAAAAWAERNQLYDRAIAAADKTEAEHDLALRYLTPFRDNLKAKAQEVGLDESWVYGLIRQESRFLTIARSGVGASGLMQVMPATAQYVAKKIGLAGFKNSDITNIDTNLTLGTNYLRMVYDQHGQSPVLASAGYNAGPGRPSAWKRRLGEGRVVEGALFTELIPFDETRDYVKNVMSNTVAYSLLLNNSSTPLKQRLGMIQGSN